MSNYALKDIVVGKNSGRPLDPSDIEFSFYSFGYSVDEDGEVDKYPSFQLITHTYNECSIHNVQSKQLSKYKDVNIAKLHLLCASLIKIVTTLSIENDNDEYIEWLLKILQDWVDDGNMILQSYSRDDGNG